MADISFDPVTDIELAAVDTSAWDGPAAMSRATQSDDPAAAYAAICAGYRDGDKSLQSTWALPHHDNPGDPPNAAGVRNSLARLSQTQGLANQTEAESHLQNHLDDIRAAEGTAASVAAKVGDLITLDLPAEALQTLSVKDRKIGLRIVPYDVVAIHPKYGALMFKAGAFGEVDPSQVRLRMDHEDPPTGLGTSFSERPDGGYMDFKLSKTQRAEDQLTLATDGVSRGASIGFNDIVGRPKVQQIGGRNVTVYGPDSAVLAEVSTTWSPTFSEAGVMYVLSKDEKGDGPVAETAVAAPEPGPIDYEKMAGAVSKALATAGSDSKIDALLEKFDKLVEQQRAQFTVPHGEVVKPKLKDWFGVTLRQLAGEKISETELKTLALDDVVTGDNVGLVPEVFTADYDDLISQDRPFLSSTREVRPPATGNSMTLPIITTRAAAGTQYGGEKTEVTTTAPKVGTGNFPGISVFAGADISIQMVLRADRSFLDLLDQEFAEAYALDEEQKAIAALLTGYTDTGMTSHTVQSGGAMDPQDPGFGTAFKNSVVASKRRPTHIWMSVDAVAAFIDAKEPLTNAPLYSNLAAAFTAGGGTGGVLSGLTPIYVPALDGSGVDVIIGPSRGFVWAEDPRIRLTADNPSLAGRDILLAGTLFAAPRYADAFTTYTIGS